MLENIRMDSHKLLYHPRRVADWLEGKRIYPIEIEISPSGACNHRCIFCAVDYLGYQPDFLDKDTILRNVEQMEKCGLKSVICSGEGEPLLNKNLPDMVNGIKRCGVDVAMSSNGALFTEEIAEECLAAFTWIRFSVASLDERSYYKIQQAKKGDLERVKKNLRAAVEVKKRKRLSTTLGVQCLLLPENLEQVPDMAKQLCEIGVDYLTVKPYSQHLHSNHEFKIDYDALLDMEKELRQYETEEFSIYFRANAMKKMHHRKMYPKCYGLPFMTHIDAKGNVWPCVAHIGDERFRYGNIYENSFLEIWEGKKRQEADERFASMDIQLVCREACRLDEINLYLHQLKHPGTHVNFI